jgi:hypothetical protein
MKLSIAAFDGNCFLIGRAYGKEKTRSRRKIGWKARGRKPEHLMTPLSKP